jgi:hypothetical protein
MDSHSAKVALANVGPYNEGLAPTSVFDSLCCPADCSIAFIMPDVTAVVPPTRRLNPALNIAVRLKARWSLYMFVINAFFSERIGNSHVFTVRTW